MQARFMALDFSHRPFHLQPGGGVWAPGIFQSHQIGRGAREIGSRGLVGQARVMIDGVGVRIYVWKPTENPIVHAGVFGGFTGRANATACGLDSGADWEQ
jgi:hypothetical protein